MPRNRESQQIGKLAFETGQLESTCGHCRMKNAGRRRAETRGGQPDASTGDPVLRQPTPDDGDARKPRTQDRDAR